MSNNEAEVCTQLEDSVSTCRHWLDQAHPEADFLIIAQQGRATSISCATRTDDLCGLFRAAGMAAAGGLANKSKKDAETYLASAEFTKAAGRIADHFCRGLCHGTDSHTVGAIMHPSGAIGYISPGDVMSPEKLAEALEVAALCLRRAYGENEDD